MIRHQAVVVALVCLMCVAAAADVKYTMEMQTGPGMPSLSTTVYVKGQLERRDMTMPGMGTQISTITNCATRQTTVVNAKCGVYSTAGPEGRAPEAASGAGPARKGGVVKVINEIRDTGERQTMLGQQARHLLLKTRLEAGPGACISGQTEMDMDMWVINMAGFSPDCHKFGEPPASPQAGGCRDTYEVVNRGATAAMGLPVKQTFTTTVNGQRHSMTMEVKELSTQTLDASLFAPPAGAKQAASAQEVYTCGMGPMMAGGMQAQMAEAMKRAREEQARQQKEQPAQTPIPTPYAVGEVGSGGAGRRGVILIGVVTTDKSGKAPPDRLTSQIIEQIGNAQGFQGLPIEARDPAAIEKEAADKKCQFLLYDDVAEAKSTMPKLGGLLGRATGRGGSVEPTQSIRAEYRLTLVQPFDQQVARDTLSQSEQAPSMEPVAGNLATKIAERAVSDARRWKQQNK